MKKIILVGCSIGAMILAAMCFMIMIGVGYEGLVGLTILEVIYLLAFMSVVIIHGARSILEEKNNKKIPVKIDEKVDNINYIVKNDDESGI